MQSSRMSKIREGAAQALSYVGVILALSVFALGVLGGGLYFVVILLTEGRDGLLIPATQRWPLASLLWWAMVLAFILGTVLVWLGGRMSADPRNRFEFPLRASGRTILDLARVGGWPLACFVFVLWFIVRLDFGQALLGGIFFLGGIVLLISRLQFGDLSDRKSGLYVKNRDLINLQQWFCGECDKCFLPTHWLIAASSDRSPDYTAQCPECRGGNTRRASMQQEEECERA